ncbi:hypothetical protein TNCV_3479991 [Trichonephila clavipes]|nr:hypothetical protein TNCV_3479991 [Trichonephila clavipes]
MTIDLKRLPSGSFHTRKMGGRKLGTIYILPKKRGESSVDLVQTFIVSTKNFVPFSNPPLTTPFQDPVQPWNPSGHGQELSSPFKTHHVAGHFDERSKFGE